MSKIQVIHDAQGKPAFAVVPWNEYVSATGEGAEDAALIAMADRARDEERFPADVVSRLVAGEKPVKVFREWRKLKQGELAAKAGVSKQYVSQLETGHREIGRRSAEKLAAALGISVDALFG